MNTNHFSLIALVLSVFFAGAYLRGEISRRQELKAELREIKMQQKQTMARVDSVNAAYLRDKIQLLDQTRAFYADLDQIIAAKLSNTNQIRHIRSEIDKKNTDIAIEIGVLKKALEQQKLEFDTDDDN